MAQKTNIARKNNVETLHEPMYWHSIDFAFPYTIHDVKRYQPALLSTAMNRLVMGTEALSAITNEQFFNSICHGGMWVNTAQRNNESDESFFIRYYLMVFSGDKTLFKQAKEGIKTRFTRMALKGATIEFESAGVPINGLLEIYSEIKVFQFRQILVDIDLACSDGMGEDFKTFCHRVLHDDAHVFGGLPQYLRELKSQYTGLLPS